MNTHTPVRHNIATNAYGKCLHLVLGYAYPQTSSTSAER